MRANLKRMFHSTFPLKSQTICQTLRRFACLAAIVGCFALAFAGVSGTPRALASILGAGVQQKQTGPAPKRSQASSPKKQAAAAAPAQEQAAQMTPTDLAAFFDGLVPLQIERDDISGAVVAVVKDGKVIFAKGYGYSDLTHKKPVSPENTLFRVGSISKLFTWTAVMQQVQAGKINLDGDINQYLDFHVAEPFGKPITMRDLMTHTAGFEETIQDLIQLRPPAETARQFLTTHTPAEIFPPGQVGAYSNYGATMAAYIVQRVSGENFNDYIERHIFQPLDITHASFRQPLPPNLQPMMSDGYQLASSGKKPFEFVNTAPAGSLAISAMDITHFMIAHLQDGMYNGAQILNPATVKLMHSRQYAPDPQVNGMCLGFYEESRNGHRIIGHGGDTIYFHSDLHLIPDANTGLFVSYNSAGRGAVEPRGPLFEKFMDRYFPYDPPDPKPLPTEAQDLRAVSGTYIASRRPQTNLLYLFAVIGETSVGPGKNGALVMSGSKNINGQLAEWHEVAPMTWIENSDPQQKIVFKRGLDGKWNIALEFPAIVLQQVSWYQTKNFVQIGLIFVLAVFALTLILWPIAALARRHYHRPLEVSERERLARRWVRIVCLLDLAFWALFIGTIVYAGSHLAVLSHTANPWFRFIQIIGWLGVIGTIIAVWNFFVSWGAPRRWWWAKVNDTLILVACLLSVWFIWFAHLLAFSLSY